MRKKLTAITAMMLLLVLTLALGVSPAYASDMPRVVDEADILTSSEEAALTEMLREAGDKYGLDIVAVALNTYSGTDIGKFTEKFYDDNGYGYDSDGSGVIMLIALNDGEWYIDRIGTGVDKINDKDLDSMYDEILPYLEDGDFYGAFGKFCTMTADSCEAYENYYGPTDPSYPPGPDGPPVRPDPVEEPYPLAANLGISGVLGAVVSFITTARNKSKLKSVRSKEQAGDYVRKDSLRLADNRDLFLYSQVSRVPRPKSNNQGAMAGGAAGGAMMGHRPSGGSTFHTTSNGRRHGGKGGKF